MTAALWPWAQASLFTQIVEAPIYRRLLGVTWPRALLPSALTHPIVWFVFPPVARGAGIGYASMLVAAEVFAWLAEATLLAKTKPAVRWPRALLASFAANAASLALGLASRWLLGAP